MKKAELLEKAKSFEMYRREGRKWAEWDGVKMNGE